MTRRKTLVAGGLSILFLALGVWAYSRLSDNDAAFDQAVWLQGDQADFSSDTPRLKMADGIIRSAILVGKLRSEVKSLLGSPTKTDKFREYDLVYWLGAERSIMSIDSEWLVVKFDNTGKVKEAKIVRD